MPSEGKSVRRSARMPSTPARQSARLSARQSRSPSASVASHKKTDADREASAPPVPALNRYIRRWISEEQPSDPVFRSAAQLAAVERKAGRSIQPFAHALPGTFPTTARRFGLKRYVPDSPIVPVGSRGVRCWLNGKHESCHRYYLPAFLYTHADAVCTKARGAKIPTLVWSWTVESELLPSGSRLTDATSQTCWYCYTGGHSRSFSQCGVLGLKLSEVEGGSDYASDSPSPTPAAQVQAPVSPLPSKRDAIEADLTPPPHEPPQKQHIPRIRYAKPQPIEHLERSDREQAPSPLNKGHSAGPSQTTETIDPAPEEHFFSPIESEPGQFDGAQDGAAGLDLDNRATQTVGLHPNSKRLWRTYKATLATGPSTVATQTLGLSPATPSRVPTAALRPPIELDQTPGLGTGLSPLTHPYMPRPMPAAKFGAHEDRIKMSLDQAVQDAEKHIDALKALRSTAAQSVSAIIAMCHDVATAADIDRMAIAGVRAQRDRLEMDLRTLEGRSIEYTEEMNRYKQINVELESEGQRLQQLLASLRQQQGVVEKRHHEAIKSRDEAVSNARSAHDAQQRAEKTARKAIIAKEKADAALADASAEIEELYSEVHRLQSAPPTSAQHPITEPSPPACDGSKPVAAGGDTTEQRLPVPSGVSDLSVGLALDVSNTATPGATIVPQTPMSTDQGPIQAQEAVLANHDSLPGETGAEKPDHGSLGDHGEVVAPAEASPAHLGIAKTPHP